MRKIWGTMKSRTRWCKRPPARSWDREKMSSHMYAGKIADCFPQRQASVGEAVCFCCLLTSSNSDITVDCRVVVPLIHIPLGADLLASTFASSHRYSRRQRRKLVLGSSREISPYWRFRQGFFSAKMRKVEEEGAVEKCIICLGKLLLEKPLYHHTRFPFSSEICRLAATLGWKGNDFPGLATF